MSSHLAHPWFTLAFGYFLAANWFHNSIAHSQRCYAPLNVLTHTFCLSIFSIEFAFKSFFVCKQGNIQTQKDLSAIDKFQVISLDLGQSWGLEKYEITPILRILSHCSSRSYLFLQCQRWSHSFSYPSI